ncbi:hypothetical protein ABZT06_08285 [Streptomyces sp. NPDC005483]|uniref:hypothetical protein n=1 Tax=Streptomyces sp. NPDC005483 TaxID=3154882 RepID=UPI0033A8E30C
MARLQILELPEGSDDDRPPFVLVVDQCMPQRIALGADAPYRDYWQDLADKIGARGVIVTPETVDIPANDTPVDPDGYPLKIRVEPDFEQFRQQVQDEIRKAEAELRDAIRHEPMPKPHPNRCCTLAFQTLGRQHIDDCPGTTDA